ncbi:hypothetical protein [Ectopseudomonas khazarica]|uniref:Uncharacterized protein n=1 Tax=Ectopseudomonas khazarica TaxID=2502979 RepID=A0ABW7MJT3_9GAMM
MTSIHPRLALALTLALLTPAGTLMATTEPENNVMSLSLPPGGCRLTIFPNGSGTIHYGAAPWTVRVDADTFDFEHVQSLLFHALKWRAEARSGIEPASVVFPGSNKENFIADTSLVHDLLEQGWAKRLPPQSPWHDEGHNWIERACAFE